jgi:Domain of unknown function (DUF1835)
MLHITNGGSAASGLREAGLPGTVLAWNDVLHEGPVPAGLIPEALRDVRVRFLAASGWATYESALADFTRRDDALARAADQDEVVLWFEHDLYDQLQLLQILDRLARLALGPTRFSLIAIDHFLGVVPFHGLGQLAPGQLASLYPTRRRITAPALALGRAGWRAFTAPDPTAITDLLAGDTSPLPFLRAALLRHLEQFPAVRDGLARTERQMLQALAGGPLGPGAIFQADQQQEAHPFMGDSILWSYILRLGKEPQPLLARTDEARFLLPIAFGRRADFLAQRLRLTPHGEAVLAGTADAVRGRGIDHWLGGVRLWGPDAPWRWDAQAGRIVAAA